MTRKGVWNLQQVRDKYLQSLWVNDLQLWATGSNAYGNLGQNDRTPHSSPVQIPGTSWSDTNGKTTFYNEGGFGNIKTDGTLWMFGQNTKGQIGQNDTNKRSSPVQVGSDTTWAEVNCGNACTFATKTDGTAWVWGNNYYGKLGQNNMTYYSSPVQIPGTNWSHIYPTRYSGRGIKTDGTLWAWGHNNDGQLGQNNRTKYSSPTQIPGTTWVDLSGDENTIATKTDGTLWTWGKNDHGELGLNDQADRSSPVQIPGTSWTSEGAVMTINNSRGAAIKTDGTLWMWGRNDDGDLGQNGPVYAHASSPIQIPGTTWSKISMCNGNYFAIKTDATMWAWGVNSQGDLGQNNRSKYSSPTQVLGSWSSVTANIYGIHGTKTSLTPSQL